MDTEGPDQQTLTLLAERFPKYRMLITQSDRLLAAVGAVRTATGASPEAIADVLGANELESEQRPIGVLVSRCSEAVTTLLRRSRQSAGRPAASPARTRQTLAPVPSAATPEHRPEDAAPVEPGPRSTARPPGGGLRPTPQAPSAAPVARRPAAAPVTRRPAPPPQAREQAAPPAPTSMPTQPGRLPERSERTAMVPRDRTPVPRGSRAMQEAVHDPAYDAEFIPASMLPMHRDAPSRGWQRALYRITSGRVNVGLSPAELEELELVERIQAPIQGYRHVAVLSMRGGSGKTTTTTMMGHTFARFRGDRVVAMDAAPDAGTLSYRVRRETTASIKDLLKHEAEIERYADVRMFASQAQSRLEVIASDTSPELDQAFDAEQYRRAANLLSRFYSVIVTDCGPGVTQLTMDPIMELTDQVVIVTSASIDGGRSGSLLLDWMEAHGYEDLIQNAVVVINNVPDKPLVNLDDFIAHFGERCRDVLEIPHDAHLAVGGETTLEELAPSTRRSYLDLAASVADGFGDDDLDEEEDFFTMHPEP